MVLDKFPHLQLVHLSTRAPCFLLCLLIFIFYCSLDCDNLLPLIIKFYIDRDNEHHLNKLSKVATVHKFCQVSYILHKKPKENS